MLRTQNMQKTYLMLHLINKNGSVLIHEEFILNINKLMFNNLDRKIKYLLFSCIINS